MRRPTTIKFGIEYSETVIRVTSSQGHRAVISGRFEAGEDWLEHAFYGVALPPLAHNQGIIALPVNLLRERGPDILNGASKANSALLHTGYDAKPGSLELACVEAGYREYLEIHERLGLSVLETSAIMVAWTAEEAAQLPAMLDHARRCGVGV